MAPWIAAARIIELSRVVPSTQKSVSTTSSNTISEICVMASPQQEDHTECGQRRGGDEKLRKAIHADPRHHGLDRAYQEPDQEQSAEEHRPRCPGIESRQRHEHAHEQ